jgi:hypothetical protein
MRRRILAGVQTRTAVVTQVGQIMNVSFAKLQAPRHGGENRTKALAIAAAIADLKLAGNFFFSAC